jgi:taurine dioxygenase
MGASSDIEVTPLTNVIGAEVAGVDRRRPLDDGTRAELRDALRRHLVLFFRGQPLTDDEQLRFASNFGEPYDPYLDSSSMAPQARVFVTIEDTPDSPPKADHWHTDVPFRSEPPDIAVLHMRVMPPVGGDTLWVNTRALHDRLSPLWQRLLASLQIEVGIGTPVKSAYERDPDGDARYQQLLRDFPPSRHPLVRVHPETGRAAVYFPGREFLRGIVGMHRDESDMLLAMLERRLDDPNVQCRWRWRQHDLVMWDERCTVHRATSDHQPSHRVVRRCLVGHGTPVGVTAATQPA